MPYSDRAGSRILRPLSNALPFIASALLFIVPASTANAASLGVVDSVRLGDAGSELAHGLRADNSDVISGALGEPARRLLPPASAGWEGGKVELTLKVDPAKPNYVTAKFWGSDVNLNRLILFCEGKQIGYRHLGDVDILDFGSEGAGGGYNGRFYYNTFPLPTTLTAGKAELRLEVRCTGRVWGYASTFEQFQKPMTEPTRGVYALYTHADGCFVPPTEEKQGDAPADPPVRKTPGPEVLDQVKQRVGGEVKKLLASEKPLNQVQMHLLAKAYHVKWTPAYQNPAAVEQIVKGCDALYIAYKADGIIARSDPAVYNGGWFGLGMAGDAVRLLADPLKAHLDEEISGQPGTTRRAGWSRMLQASRDWHRRHRRLYTNQSMITDLNIYRANRGVEAIDPAHAMPESQVLDYLYQSLGMKPWLGSDTNDGPDHAAGENYYELTSKGLSKELGYVGYYGEVLDWATQIYDATRETGQEGDGKIKAQLEKIAGARAVFRYPMLDADGDRAMRIETIVGWRDMHYPGEVTYGERPSWDASALYTAAATLDAASLGYARQMFDDNQFFASVQRQLKDGGVRVTAGLLGVPDQYETVMARPAKTNPENGQATSAQPWNAQAADARSLRLPMTPGQPDFVFADEEDGVVAVKRGDDILYASLYWRARYAVNFLARVHFITPRFDRLANVREETVFQPSGMEYTRPDWTNFGFGNGGPKYPGDLHSALAGERLPIAKIPEGFPFKPGNESTYAGRGDFYTLRYGQYLIGMNCTAGKTFKLITPAGVGNALRLEDNSAVPLGASADVKPKSTVVLWLGDAR